MQYFAGLDISMEETHVCVLTRNGTVVYEALRTACSTLPRARRDFSSRARGGIFGAQDGRASINFRVLYQLIKA